MTRFDNSIDNNIYNKIRIKLQSFDSELLSLACSNFAETINSLDGRINGPIRLPTSTHYYCVLNSPHVYKKSREHFEVSQYKRLLNIYIPKNNSIVPDSFYTIPVPPGVRVDIVS